MTKKARVAAIIPAFNEEKTVANVVKVVSKSDLVDEVIVVSDGSTDKTEEKASAAGAGTVLNLPVQSGKGAALQHGVTFTDAPIILFLDADLKGFTEKHVKILLDPVLSGAMHMTVGIRDRGLLSKIISPHLALISGERALHRDIFEDIPDVHLRGFMIETSLNYACRVKKLNYGAVFMPGVRIRTKFHKVGFVTGIKQYVKMWWQIIKAMLIVRWAHGMEKFTYGN